MSPSVVNPAAGGRLGALTFWGFGPGRNGRTGIMDTYYGSLGPRLGLAYQLTKRTVLRASYGIDTWPNAASEFSSGGGQAPNFGFGATVSQSSLDSFTPVLYWDNGVNILPPVPTSIHRSSTAAVSR